MFSLSPLFSKGVHAGTVIKNIATLDFSLDGEEFLITSNVEKSVVAQLVDVKVSWIDINPIAVNAGDKKRVLAFKVLNSGNGRDKFRLFAQQQDFKSDFLVDRKVIYVDRNDNYRFDSEDRIRKTFALQADEEKVFFVVSNMPKDKDIPNTSESFINFRAVSKVGGSGQKGAIHVKSGVKKVDAVDGESGGISEDEGSYKLFIANVVLSKDVTQNEDGLITVRVDVSVSGEGSVKNVKVVDVIPNEVIYIKNSLALDGASLSDQKDGDEGRYKRKYKSRKAYVELLFGELDTSSHHVITYNLRIR